MSKNKLTAEKAEKEMEKILLDDEWIPKMNDKNWKEVKINNNMYYSYDKLPKIELFVTEKMINLMKRYVELRELYDVKKKYEKKEDYEDNIYKIIKFYDDKTSFISYTRGTVENALKSNIIAYLLKSGSNKKFEMFSNIDDIKVKLVGCYKGNLSNKELENIKNIYLDEKKDISNNDIYVLYSYEIQKLITPDLVKNIKNNKYHIYRIYKKTNELQQYIFGSFEVYKNKDIDFIIDKYSLFFDKGTILIESLEQIECRLEVEGLIKVDEYIFKKNSIEKGLNRCYNIINSKYKNNDLKNIKSSVFLIVQNNIMNILFEDNNKYNKIKGYIGCIEDDLGKKYLFSGKNLSLKSKLDYFYSLENICETSHKKLIDMLKIVKFDKLKIYIIEKYIEDEELDKKLNFYINRMNTNIDGLNCIEKPMNKFIGALMSKKNNF
jgi:hypothetical protein